MWPLCERRQVCKICVHCHAAQPTSFPSFSLATRPTSSAIPLTAAALATALATASFAEPGRQLRFTALLCVGVSQCCSV